MKIRNETDYETRDLRRFFSAGLCAMKASSEKVIEVRKQTGNLHCSRATLGEVRERKVLEQGDIVRKWKTSEGRWIRMLTYQKDGELDLRRFARVFEHEVLHSKGAEHKDMTEHQMKCDLPLPAWAEGLSIRKKPPKPPVRREELLRLRAIEKEDHARKTLALYERKQKRLAGLLRKWRAKEKYYERRRAAKREELLNQLPKGGGLLGATARALIQQSIEEEYGRPEDVESSR
jgi:hypothetical protein